MQLFPEIIRHCNLEDRRAPLLILAFFFFFLPEEYTDERMSTFSFWAWNVNQILCEISVSVYQTVSYLIGCQCLKSLGTMVINLSHCLWQSQGLGCFTPLYHLESIFWHTGFSTSGKGQHILQVLAGCFQHSLSHYLLSHIFFWVKGFSSLSCFVPIFFFLLSKAPSSHSSKAIYEAWTSTPSRLCGSTELQTELWSILIALGAGAVPDSLAYSWNPLPSTRLPCSTLMWWYGPGLILTFYALFGWCLWTLLFSEGGEEDCIWEKRGW